jgi:pseudouridine-5'-phosphate glycosidase
MPDPVQVAPEVADAVAAGAAVVALESTLISHGLPRPRNLAVARELESLVRAGGAVPATIAVVDGVVRVGLSEGDLVRIATTPDVRKLSVRDLPIAVALGQRGATTVSATAHVAALAGIAVFATGGLGGVHRGFASSFDESADLQTLSKTPITVVSAGVKSILDVPATLQRLETLGVGVVGFGTRQFPGFYRRDSGEQVDWQVDTAEQVAAIMVARAALRAPGALIVANPVAADHELDQELHDTVLAEALRDAQTSDVHGQAITPFLLDRMASGSGGRSLEANLQAVYGNATLAARIAAAWAARR